MTRRLSFYPPFYLRAVAVLSIMTLCAAFASAATESVLYNFQPRLHGQQPSGGLIADAAGNLYGATFWGGSYGLGTVFELTPNSHGGWSETVLYNFTGGSDVYAPNGSLVFDSAGNLYGAGLEGGVNEVGGVFRLKPGSGRVWTETVLYAFPTRGGWPNGGWVFDQSGNLYGTTLAEGGNTVYELSPGPNDQWTASVIYQFASAELNGNLIVDKEGNLYGTAIQVGNNNGEVFELSPSSGGSWTETMLYGFRKPPDAEFPGGGVIADSSGNLYGVAINGGSGTGCDSGPCGAVYELIRGKNSWSEKVLYSFQGGNDGRNPYGVLSFDTKGNLCGTTYYGGTADYGTVFELVHSGGDWTETILWNYTGGSDGGNPDFGVTLGASGQVYVAASVGAGVVGNYDGNPSVLELIPSDGKVSETILTRFPITDGAAPETGLIADSAGNFYGTTAIGGAYNYGTVFELTRSSGGVWTEQVLYSFKHGLDFNQGAFPSSLILDSHGNLFGETAYDGQAGRGTVFELSPAGGDNWSAKELYAFTGGADGGQPYGGLALDSEGNLYGTTEYGGKSSACGVLECGTVFKLTQSSGNWTESVLYNFAGGANDGANPMAGLIFDQNGNLYGTTRYGVDLTTCTKGCGVVFELSPASGSWTEHLLYAFTNSNHDGREPEANLIFDSSGNLYGTTSGGGTNHETCCGTAFELSLGTGNTWSEKVLLYFPPNKSQGAYPSGPMAFDGSGNLYGVTPLGGQNQAGTVYELSPASGGIWNETVLYSFTTTANERGGAAYPVGGVILDSSGNLYGTAGDGQSGFGTIFEITP
jgi:uncharacterized repeat protein (TIGR03803 family)